MKFIVTWNEGRDCAVEDNEHDALETVKNLLEEGKSLKEVVVYKADDGESPRVVL